ncbi:DUF4112 domain-containing protein [Halorubellus sp. PRR65]|uniref:DUF4112 domain-containing protein n=1 Tax=Halorubellus sp. PRR65 TaxID=3098148 RepID=UPI002B258524|nr:DUF4112 domain-containing protein [Halorubellus sp. PRR65]
MTDGETDPFADPYDGPIPEGVDEAAVERMRLVAKVMDDAVALPGTDFRVGADPVLGVLPGVGDVVAAGVSMYVVLESARLGVSYGTLVEMLANVTIDVAGGAIPYVGTVVDVVFKSNQRNLALALDDLADGASDTVFASVEDAAADAFEGAADATEEVVDAAADAASGDGTVSAGTSPEGDGPVEIPIEVEDEDAE